METFKLNTIAEYHQFRGLPGPEHPLISVIDVEKIERTKLDEPQRMMNNFYSIALKKNCNARMRYGQQEFDFTEGVLMCMAPGQILSLEANVEFTHTGWLLLVHPDFLWNTPLASSIKQYEFFSYTVNESLHLSEKEEATMDGIIHHIRQEYHANIDKFSQSIIIAQLELLLTYTERFYQRQFLMRKITNHKLLSRLEDLLIAYFNNDSLLAKGLPTVQYIADHLNVSPNYLSGMLRVLTGQSTQHHIHDKLMEKAKEKLSLTELSVSEIAYQLGFEHPQSFSKLFKLKTNFSPSAFRESFN